MVFDSRDLLAKTFAVAAAQTGHEAAILIMRILGISALYHDAAAAIIEDGVIRAAVQEERLTRIKNDPQFPHRSIQECFSICDLRPQDINWVVFYDKPFLKFNRLLETYLAFSPRGWRQFSRSFPVWIKNKLFQKSVILDELAKWEPEIEWSNRLLFSEHHLSHAASAFYASPFDEAVILTMDGVGEWTTTSVAIGKAENIDIIKEIRFPHSLGLLYSAFTVHCGFKVNSGEYKLMGLAPYGEPKFKKLILRELIDVKPDGSFRLNMKYFDYCTKERMTNDRFQELFQVPARSPDAPVEKGHIDMAASIQSALEEIVVRITRQLHREFKIDNLVLAGGVALNCVANGKVLRDQSFKNIWIQPAAGDAGGAIGAALAAYHLHLKQPRIQRRTDGMAGAYLGPSFSPTDCAHKLVDLGARFKVLEFDEIKRLVAQKISEGAAVGWFQGPLEFGPRALGNRSILADPRSEHTQKRLNIKTKFRESFRPFAPAVLAEEVHNWFEMDRESPYMLLVADVLKKHRTSISVDKSQGFGILNQKRSSIPAITHVDYSARIQTVHRNTNPKFHALIEAFQKITGVPIVVNTSFNVRGEPIVCTPEDAYRCFMGTDIDLLVIENCVLEKSEQTQQTSNYASQFQLD